MRTTATPRNFVWDVFRGIAALMVIFHHYTNRYDTLFGHIEQWAVKPAFDIGAWGVCVFFVLTGLFLIPSLMSSNNLWAYYKKRIIRLYPAYVPCVIITWVLMTCTPPPLGSRTVGFVSFLGNLTMFQSFIRVPNVDGAYWTLAVQLIVYIFIGALFFLLKKDVGKLLNAMFLWLILGCCVWFLNSHLGISKLSFISDAKYIHLFIQGILLYCIGARHGKLCQVYLFLLASVCYDLLWFSIPYFVFNVILVLLILIIHWAKLNLNKKGLFVFIGSISFPLYLLHQNIGYIIIRDMEQRGLTNEIWIILPVLIVIALAWLVSTFVEQPLSKKLKSLLIK